VVPSGIGAFFGAVADCGVFILDGQASGDSWPESTGFEYRRGLEAQVSNVAEKLAQKNPSRLAPAKQVRLKLVYLNLWSSVKVSFLIGVSLGIFAIFITVVAWMFLSQTGAFDQLDSFISGVTTTGARGSVKSLLTFNWVLGFSVILGLLNVIVVTVIGVVVTLLYNLSVKFTDGLFIGFTDA
jgi:hypothetical protein